MKKSIVDDMSAEKTPRIRHIVTKIGRQDKTRVILNCLYSIAKSHVSCTKHLMTEEQLRYIISDTCQEKRLIV